MCDQRKRTHLIIDSRHARTNLVLYVQRTLQHCVNHLLCLSIHPLIFISLNMHNNNTYPHSHIVMTVFCGRGQTIPKTCTERRNSLEIGHLHGKRIKVANESTNAISHGLLGWIYNTAFNRYLIWITIHGRCFCWWWASVTNSSCVELYLNLVSIASENDAATRVLFACCDQCKVVVIFPWQHNQTLRQVRAHIPSYESDWPTLLLPH